MKTNQTVAERIRLEIARRIVKGRIAPGETLDETQLAGEFDVSRTPVREALRQLASSGLIDQRPHQKAVVTKPDEETLHGMFAVMGYLETICAGLCAPTMSSGERTRLLALHKEMEAMVRAGDGQAYTIANETFHSAIYDGTHNAYLAEITLNTRQRVQPFRRAQFETLGRLAASHAEHSAVVDAIMAADRAQAENAMKAHIGFVEEAWRRFANRVQPAATKALQEP